MDWQKHEGVSRFAKIGDGPNDKKSIEGVLVRIERNRKYPANLDYILHDGEGLVAVREAESIRQALDFSDYGKPVKIVFAGWAPTKSGNQMKVIEVFKLDGPYDAKVKAQFPMAGKYAPAPGNKEDMRGKKEEDEGPSTSFEKMPDALDGADDDLPF